MKAQLFHIRIKSLTINFILYCPQTIIRLATWRHYFSWCLDTSHFCALAECHEMPTRPHRSADCLLRIILRKVTYTSRTLLRQLTERFSENPISRSWRHRFTTYVCDILFTRNSHPVNGCVSIFALSKDLCSFFGRLTFIADTNI